MTPKEEKILFMTAKANKAVETAYWWMRNIDTCDIDNAEVLSKVQEVLELLKRVDKVTIDIIIKGL